MSRRTDHALGAAAQAPTMRSSPNRPRLCPHHTATTYSGFQTTVQASRYADDVPVFHAARGIVASAECPIASEERVWPDRMSETIQQAGSEKMRVCGGLLPSGSMACGRVWTPPRAMVA